MNPDPGATALWKTPRSRRLIAFALLGALIGASFLFEHLLRSVEDASWTRVRDRVIEQRFETASQAFRSIQRDTRRVATGLAQDPAVRAMLAGRTGGRAAMFATLAGRASGEQVGIELYDRTGTLRAWAGEPGPDLQREVARALDGRLASGVAPTPIAEQLFVAVPVRELGMIVGAVMVRRTIEIEYPLDNAFVRSTRLTDRLPDPLARTVQYEFGVGRERPAAPEVAARLLYGIDSTIVGRILISPPSAEEYHAERARSIATWRSLLLLLTAALVLAMLARRVAAHPSELGRLAAYSAMLWAGRFALLLLDIPSGIVSGGIFDPATFASTFGWGLARSLGELTITAGVVAVQAWILFRSALASARRAGERPAARALPLVFSVLLTVVLFWGLRGYGAVVRSAVFDSTLAFSDPRSLLPGLPLGLMAVNLVIISASAALMGVAIAFRQLSLLARAFGPVRGTAAVALLYGAALVAFALIQGTPILDPLHRALLAVALLTGGVVARQMVRSGPPLTAVRTGAGLVLLSALLLIPVLRSSVQERTRDRIELMAREILRPVDAWLTFVVEEALAGVQTPRTVDILRSGDPERIERLAFSVWARSVACREGYAATVVITDPRHRELSRFTIGGQADLTARLDAELRLTEEPVTLVRTEGTGVTAVRSYGASAPILGRDGTLLGYGRVVIAATRRSLFRGENPPVLRAGGGDAIVASRVMVSEFQDGRLLPSGGTEFPIGYELPAEVRHALGARDGVWWEETVGSRMFTTYFARSDRSPETVVALSVSRPAGTGLVTETARMVIYYLLTLLVAAALSLPILVVRGSRPLRTFRSRLLAALVFTALLPLVVIGFYGRQLARERMDEITSLRLEDRTLAVAGAVGSGIGRDGTDVIVQISSPVAEAVAEDIGADFNIYLGSQLVTSSRPELYESGMLDRRMNGEAYAAVLLKGRRFHVQSERIGEYPYAVGYRPITDADGVVLAVVAVPTLYTHEEIEEEATAQNAALIMAFAVLMAIVLAIASLFARRIAAPVQRLTAAMRRIARGDLDVRVSEDHPPRDEVGELMQSFDGMVRDLKRSREELIKYERDVAWNEMARQVVHEIKNPLTPMKLSVQHLRQTYRDRVPDFDQVLDRVTRTLIEQIDALSRIASEFASFARMPRRKLVACNINDILQEAVQLFAPHEGVQFELRFSYDIADVLADRGELRRAFINVFRNAVQAMEGSGQVSVVTEALEQGVLVRILDTGPGIPPEMRERLFQPNFSTKTEGMGLGLAIVKRTVDDMGGTITIESPPEGGTRVSIFLPLPAESPEGS